MAIVTLLLLVACANVAKLLLARWTARERECAIRLSLGAGRWQVARQLLTEGLILSVIGGIAGLLVADWASTMLAAAAQVRGVMPARVALDGRVLTFCAIVSIATSLAFGVIPARARVFGQHAVDHVWLVLGIDSVTHLIESRAGRLSGCGFQSPF